jgi:hypothetical protein
MAAKSHDPTKLRSVMGRVEADAACHADNATKSANALTI